jgi:hypothetical protein
MGGDKFRLFPLNPACGFANDLNVADNRVLCLLVCLKRLNAIELLTYAMARSIASAMCSR